MSTAISHVVYFAKAGADPADGTDPAAKAATPEYRILVAPPRPLVGDVVTVTILCGHAFELDSPYGGLSGKATDAAQVYDERVHVLPKSGEQIGLSQPVDTMGLVTARTPWIVLGEMRNPWGDPGVAEVLEVKNGRLSRTCDIDSGGTLHVRYQSFPPQVWQHLPFPVSGLYLLKARADFLEEPVDIPVYVEDGDTDLESTGAPTLVTVQAKDFCTDLPIEGAEVFVDGSYRGVTGANGKLVIGVQNPGGHSLKIQATGYVPTDGDGLVNDSYTL